MRPTFNDPRNHWPTSDEHMYDQGGRNAQTVLKYFVPTLDGELLHRVARELDGRPNTVEQLQVVLELLAPDLFDAPIKRGVRYDVAKGRTVRRVLFRVPGTDKISAIDLDAWEHEPPPPHVECRVEVEGIVGAPVRLHRAGERDGLPFYEERLELCADCTARIAQAALVGAEVALCAACLPRAQLVAEAGTSNRMPMPMPKVELNPDGTITQEQAHAIESALRRRLGDAIKVDRSHHVLTDRAVKISDPREPRS